MTRAVRPAPRPASAAERLHGLDAARGVAITGVLIAYTVWNLGTIPQEAWTATDRIVASGVGRFVDTKFLTIFAFLFGAGVAQQWGRWEGAGAQVATLHRRRMVFLIVMGVLHGALLRNGDILAPYGLLGLLLLALRWMPPGRTIVLALTLVVVPYFVEAIATATGVEWPARPVVTRGYFLDNLSWWVYWYSTNPFLSWPRILALMLAGLLLARVGFIDRLARSRRLANRALAVSVVGAVLARGTFEWMAIQWADRPGLWHASVMNCTYHVSAWALAAAYVSGLLRLAQSGSGARALQPLAALGRMAFTNYLAQGLLVVPICLAFDLFDRMTPARGLWLALGITLGQVAFSVWWVGRHPTGPLERVWRNFTYRSWQPVAVRAEAG